MILHDSSSVMASGSEGTDDLYLERFMKVFDDNVTVKSTTFFGGAKTIDLTNKESIKDQYVDKLRYAYKKNQRLRNAMEPMVHDFSCIIGTKMRTLEL